MSKFTDKIPLCLRIYAWDWLAIIAVLVVAGLINLIPPFQRMYIAGDLGLSYPLQSETVPNWALFFIAFLLPLVCIVTLALVARTHKWDWHQAVLALIVSLSISLLIAQILKVSVGRFRPDWYARCSFDVVMNACTGDPIIVQEGRKSFPSGHSTLSFAGLGLLSLYMAGKMRIFVARGDVYKMILVLLPLIIALLVAVSRVDNYWHHWEDVTVGGLIGLTTAILTYLHFYPSLYAKNCHVPLTDKLEPNTTPLLPLTSDNNSNNGSSSNIHDKVTSENENGHIIYPSSAGSPMSPANFEMPSRQAPQ